MNFEHIHITDIERYALHSPVLSEDERAKIFSHLGECTECKEQYETIVQFYDDVRELHSEQISDEALNILKKSALSELPKIADIIELYPAKRKSSFQNLQPSVIALAAQETIHASRYSTIGTLTSIDEQTFLRIVKDNSSGKYILQIHSDEQKNYQNVFVSFDNITGEYFTDKHGEIILPIHQNVDAINLHAYVHTPLVEFSFDDESINTFRDQHSCEIEKDGWMIRCSQHTGDTNVRIDIRSEEKSNQFKSLLIVHADRVNRLKVENNVVEIDGADIKPDSIFKLFE